MLDNTDKKLKVLGYDRCKIKSAYPRYSVTKTYIKSDGKGLLIDIECSFKLDGYDTLLGFPLKDMQIRIDSRHIDNVGAFDDSIIDYTTLYDFEPAIKMEASKSGYQLWILPRSLKAVLSFDLSGIYRNLSIDKMGRGSFAIMAQDISEITGTGTIVTSECENERKRIFKEARVELQDVVDAEEEADGVVNVVVAGYSVFEIEQWLSDFDEDEDFKNELRRMLLSNRSNNNISKASGMFIESEKLGLIATSNNWSRKVKIYRVEGYSEKPRFIFDIETKK
jgi:hypothetical protein